LIGWLLDTNVIAELSRATADATVLAWAGQTRDEQLFISVLTLAEYDKGASALAPGDPLRLRIEAGIVALEQRFAGRVLGVTDAVVRRWGVISGSVQARTGRAPPVVDTLLAATAVEHQLHLVTRNTKDVRGSGASVFNPWVDDPAAYPVS
jgi:predicted nucleic acid-binding protein